MGTVSLSIHLFIVTQKPFQLEVSLHDLLIFQRAVEAIDATIPLQFVTNVTCRLLRQQRDPDSLVFGTNTRAACNDSKDLDCRKRRRLFEIFKSEKDGNLTPKQFARGVRVVRKRNKILAKSIANAISLDKDFENLVNVGFYILTTFFVFSALGFTALSLMFGFASVVASLGLAMGSTISFYFEGTAMVLARRPYDIGDLIHYSPIDKQMDFSEGASCCIVDDFCLFSTTTRHVLTREVTTINNGVLARSRITNLTRSGKAIVRFNLRIPVGTSSDRLLIFRRAVEKFIQTNAREWYRLKTFRALSFPSGANQFIQYELILQHLDTWGNASFVLKSKGLIMEFCLELQEQLNLRCGC